MFKAEVIADASGVFCGNGLTFATKAEAIEYAQKLAWRWTLVRQWRVVEVESGAVVARSYEGIIADAGGGRYPEGFYEFVQD